MTTHADSFADTAREDARRQRWLEEARFFDRWADRVGDDALPIDPLTLARYSSPRLKRRFHKEFRLRLLGDLRGKRVLDVGCGDGVNSILLAKLGATVVGLDIAPKAIEVAHRRAAVNGVADRTSWICSPLETAEVADRSFDIVWGDAILHHLLADLELAARRLTAWTKPSGLLVFSEPLNLCPPLRRLRLMIPVTTEVTPGERPLVKAELDLLRRFVPDLRIRHFGLLGRLDAFILTHFNYERSSWPRRFTVNAIEAVDYVLCTLPGARRLGGVGVLYGHPAASAAV